MTCSATINGCPVEIKGSAIECFEFMRLVFPGTGPLYAQMSGRGKRICDPFSRHIGNCGAEECPIIAPNETLASYQWRLGIDR